jgi:hypothetical protein
MNNRKFKIVLILILTLTLLGLSSCGKKKKTDINEIRKEFNKKPTPRYLTYLKKYYKEKKDKKAILEISEIYYKAFPQDKYIKEDIGKAYSELASLEKGEKKLELLIKAVDFGYTNSLLTEELTELIGEKIKAFEKNNNDTDLASFLEKTKKLPIDSKMRMTINSKVDFLKNKAIFDKFYIPFKTNTEKKAPTLLAQIFPKKNVEYDSVKGNFIIKAVVSVQNGDNDKNNYPKTKNIAYNINLENFTILKYALEHDAKPPVGQEFNELPFPKEDFHCDGVVLSKDQKALQLICNVNILDLGKAFFSVRDEGKKEEPKKEDVKKEEPKKEDKK